MQHRHLFVAVFLSIAVAGCGGGGATQPTAPIPIATATPSPAPTSASASTPVSGAGGSVSTTLGTSTLNLTAPPNSLSAGSTLKVTLEAPSALTTPFSKARTTASKTQSVPSGAVPLAAFIVDAGGATLLAPLAISITGLPAPAAGQSVLISGFNNGSFNDVATTTYANGTYSLNPDPHYPGITLAAPTIYVIYTVPTANVTPPTATVTVTGPASVSAGTAATYTASEASANGFPFLGHTFTYGVSSSAAGTIVPSTGVLTGGGIGALANVTATDAAVSTYVGSESIAVTSARPGATGLAETYAGTLSESDANNAISTAPVVISTVSNATVNVTTAADTADTSGTTTGVTFTASESDASPLSTVSSTTASTVLYQQQSGGSINVRLKKTVATESTGVVYEHDYTATNGQTTVLPETAGTFSNDASETYLETDPGIGVTTAGQQVTITKVVNADGSYSATYLDPNYNTGVPTADKATENADFSAELDYFSIDPLYKIVYAKPANGTVSFTRTDANFGLNKTTTVPSYIPAVSAPSTETDTIAPGTKLDASCTNGATYPTATSVAQAKTVVDSIYGTVETKTTTSYDVDGVGTVCVVVNDTINAFYDYSFQEGPALINVSSSATQPLLTTTVTESLSLQKTNASTVQSTTRSAQSLTGSVLPVATIAAHVEHLAHKRITAGLQSFRIHQSLLRGGSL